MDYAEEAIKRSLKPITTSKCHYPKLYTFGDYDVEIYQRRSAVIVIGSELDLQKTCNVISSLTLQGFYVIPVLKPDKAMLFQEFGIFANIADPRYQAVFDMLKAHIIDILSCVSEDIVVVGSRLTMSEFQKMIIEKLGSAQISWCSDIYKYVTYTDDEEWRGS